MVPKKLFERVGESHVGGYAIICQRLQESHYCSPVLRCNTVQRYLCAEHNVNRSYTTIVENIIGICNVSQTAYLKTVLVVNAAIS